MRHRLVLYLLLSAQLSFAQSDAESSKYDALRLENEIKLSVPDRQVDAVWSYLLARYDTDSLYLKAIDSTFSCQVAIDSFIDQYYDDPQLSLLKEQNGLRHRSRFVLSGAGDDKDGRELVQLKINEANPDELSRGEYKYPVIANRKWENEMDTHPLLGLVKREEREGLIQRLKEHGIYAQQLAPTVKLVQLRHRIYVSRAGTAFATLTLDRVQGAFQGASTAFIELEMELNEIGYTESSEAGRAAMEEVNEIMKADLLDRFPAIVQDQTPKYNKAAKALGLSDSLPANGGAQLPLWVKIGILLLGLLALLFFTQRKKPTHKLG